jgi:hypothetical protein
MRTAEFFLARQYGYRTGFVTVEVVQSTGGGRYDIRLPTLCSVGESGLQIRGPVVRNVAGYLIAFNLDDARKESLIECGYSVHHLASIGSNERCADFFVWHHWSCSNTKPTPWLSEESAWRAADEHAHRTVSLADKARLLILSSFSASTLQSCSKTNEPERRKS